MDLPMRCLLRDDHLASAPWRRHRLPRFASDHGRRILVYSLVMAPLLAWCASAGAHPRWVDLNLAQPTPRALPETTSELLPTGFRKGPYLIYPGDPTRMRVLWQAYETTFCTLGWGTDTLYSAGAVETTEYGDDHQHSYLISDLVPATRYFYRVTLGETSSAASFITAPDDNATSVKFMLHGDTQANAASHDSVCEAMIGEYLADPAYQSLILGVGDVSNFGMLESDWDQYFFNPAFVHIRERLAHVPFNTCIGNHELYESATTYDLDAPLFRKYFPYPFEADRYWSFDYGPAHIVIADLYPWYYDPGLPNLIPPGFISPEQEQWIEDDLSSTNKRWKFVIIHEPGWSAGPHPNNPSVQDTLHPLCKIAGVDIVFAGHNHYYARADVDDIPYITTSGGAHLYWPVPGSPKVVTSRREHHFCKIEINGSVLDLWAVKPDGEIIDHFTIVKNISVNAEPLQAPVLRLYQNRPNPFRPRTSITFDLASSSQVSLRIYDVGGRLVRTLVDAQLNPDSYSVEWDGHDSAGHRVASGTYWYRLTTPHHAAAKKLVIDR
jgi:3',5'-cyclic AMP phosphodiesterase CpdA